MQKKESMKNWRVQSSDKPGFHSVIVPENSDCRAAHIFRLNLLKGESHELTANNLELNAVLINGKAMLTNHPSLIQTMEKFDSFYIPSGNIVTITATEDCIFYIGGAVCEKLGKPLFRKFDSNLPIGDIHQIHGQGSGSREVMFTLAPGDAASRLLCGLTWSGDGTWTSWPPHQHEKYLEEVYCYFDMPQPSFGLHISYLESGDTDDMAVHTVHSGTMVQAPRGYHPTVATPGNRNAYFWVLAAFTPEVRRYDLAELDPLLK